MKGSSLFSRIFGAAIVILGIVLLLNNLGITAIDVGDVISRYWPALLILWGLSAILGSGASRPDEGSWSDDRHRQDGQTPSRTSGSRAGGWIALIFGLILLSGTSGLRFIDTSRIWGASWAIIIILLGWVVLKSASSSATESATEGQTHWTVLSSLEQKTSGWQLRSGSYVAVLGGIDLDLRMADIPEGDTYLDLTAILGGINIIAPMDLHVECEGAALLGGVDAFGDETGGVIASRTFSRAGSESSTRTLTIRCRAILGGIDIK